MDAHLIKGACCLYKQKTHGVVHKILGRGGLTVRILAPSQSPDSQLWSTSGTNDEMSHAIALFASLGKGGGVGGLFVGMPPISYATEAEVWGGGGDLKGCATEHATVRHGAPQRAPIPLQSSPEGGGGVPRPHGTLRRAAPRITQYTWSLKTPEGEGRGKGRGGGAGDDGNQGKVRNPVPFGCGVLILTADKTIQKRWMNR